jgi:hypothetical protein
VTAETRNGVIRLAVLSAAVAVGFVIGLATGSWGAAAVVMLVGLAANIALRFVLR